MVMSMLDLSKMKMGKLDMRMEQIALADLTKTIVEDLSAQHTDRIQLHVEATSRAMGDHVRIGQVVTNLLSNALKYSPDDKAVIARISETDETVTMSIQDFGAGISDDERYKIFRPFYRGLDEKHRATISGSGLGLYISQEIIKHHGGKLWVDSTKGKGSTFYFSLPKYAMPKTSQYQHDNLMRKIKKVLVHYDISG